MLRLKQILILMLVLAVFSLVGVVSAADTQVSTTTVQQSELSESLYWPEAGLTLPYPADWRLVNDQNFDFVLVGPETDSSGIVYITMQSGAFDPTSENIRDIVLSFNGVSEETLIELELGDVAAYRFDSVEPEIASMFVAFSPDDATVFLLGLTATEGLWQEWQSQYEAILAEAAVDALELDTELLNEQMQSNFEATGRLMVGEVDAGLQVYEFLDFACPHCVDYHTSIDRLVQDYVLTGQANVQYGLLTFVAGELSENAAAAQVCGARLGVGWDVQNLIFAEYKAKGAQGAYTIENLLTAIEEAELDVDINAFSACMNDDETISTYLDLASTESTALGVSGTPSVLYAAGDDDFAFITTSNGQPVTRTNLLVTYDYLDQLADTETEASE